MTDPTPPRDNWRLHKRDPILEELRRVRRQLWKEAGGDVDRLMEIAHDECKDLPLRRVSNDPNSPHFDPAYVYPKPGESENAAS